MAKYVCNGAQLKCMMGDAPSMLVVVGKSGRYEGKDIANIMDHQPLTNIQPFGMCKSPSNPTVATATASNAGKLQPMPCVPNTTSPWINGKMNVKAFGQPALMTNSKLMCMWTGVIKIEDENTSSVTGK